MVLTDTYLPEVMAAEGVAASSAAGLQLAARAYQRRTGWLVPQRPGALPPSNLALPFTVEARLISVSGWHGAL